MTLATEIYFTGVNPYNTSEKIYSATTSSEKKTQRQFFFWYLTENRQTIMQLLRKLNRSDLMKKLFDEKR
jgi:hypothetical protein